jgi:hypothetical protein
LAAELDDRAKPDWRDWCVASELRAVSLWTRLPMVDDRAVARPVEAPDAGAPARDDRAAVAEGCRVDVLRAALVDCPVVRAGVWRVAVVELLREKGLRRPKELRRFQRDRELRNPPKPRRAKASSGPNRSVTCRIVFSVFSAPSVSGRAWSAERMRSVVSERLPPGLICKNPPARTTRPVIMTSFKYRDMRYFPFVDDMSVRILAS